MPWILYRPASLVADHFRDGELRALCAAEKTWEDCWAISILTNLRVLHVFLRQEVSYLACLCQVLID
jgi:hypothetical protein